MATIRLVPRKALSVDDVQAFANQRGWILEHDPLATALDDAIERHRWTIDANASLTLVENHSIQNPYLIINSPEPGPLAEAVAAQFPVYTVDQILESMKSADTDSMKVATLQGLAAMGSVPFRSDVYLSLSSMLTDNSSAVRGMACTACFHLNWRILRPLVTSTSENDADENVRLLSHNLLLLGSWDVE